MGGIPRGIQYSIDGTVDLLNTYESEALYKNCVLLPEARRIGVFENLNSPMLLALGEIRDPRAQPLAAFNTMSDYPLNAYWLKEALPRAYFASGVLQVSSHEAALSALLNRTTPLQDTVILEDARAEAGSPGNGGGHATVLGYGKTRVSCLVETTTPGYLVLLDSYYPGWIAYVDGEKTDILRANYTFRAVRLPTGRHTVEFRYRPWTVLAGLCISLSAVLIGIAVCIRDGKRNRRANCQPA
jgi:hypothetical protein